MTQEDWTYVYVMAAIEGGRPKAPVKVGMSRSFHARFQTIRTACPIEVEGLLAIPLPSREIARMVEQCFHSLFDDRRLRMEWFDLDPIEACIGLCALIKEVFEAAGIGEPRAIEHMERLGVTRALTKLVAHQKIVSEAAQ